MSIIATTSRWLLTLLVALIAIGPVAGIASAADNPNANRALERAFVRAQQHAANLQARIAKANLRADQVATWIDQAKTRGKDTTALATALSTFRSQIAAADSALQSGKAILDAREGFDQQGKVTDTAAAKTTVEDAAKQFSTTRQTLRDAYAALRQAIAEWRKANPNSSDPGVPNQE